MTKRLIDTELWNNDDIIEYFTAEDRYFWLYLLTSPHNSIVGVMKASPALMARDMGYHKDCIKNLIYRFRNVHKLITIDDDTNEMLILNWYKFNWSKSTKLKISITNTLNKIQSTKIRALLQERIDITFENKEEEKENLTDTLSIGYAYPTITNTITNTNTISNSIKDKKKSIKHKYGEYKNVLLTDDELTKLNKKYGESEAKRQINNLDIYIGKSGRPYKSHYMAVISFFKTEKEKNNKQPKKQDDYIKHNYTSEDLDVFTNLEDLEMK